MEKERKGFGNAGGHIAAVARAFCHHSNLSRHPFHSVTFCQVCDTFYSCLLFLFYFFFFFTSFSVLWFHPSLDLSVFPSCKNNDLLKNLPSCLCVFILLTRRPLLASFERLHHNCGAIPVDEIALR